MNNSYRIRTKVGVDSYLSVQLDQDFEYLEILSLKILPEQIYTRPCSDYGVIVGRLTVNGGYGIPNVKVSIFIPISEQDKLNPLIYDLYPYEKITDQNEDGYRYNLLPYKKSYSAHNPTGTFFDREDVLVSPPLIEVYDKYYKYCASTNSSGDFMIFGAPIGTYTLHADIDLSDIGEFSLSPQDLIRMGVANPGQVAGVKFRASENLNELPQIISLNKNIEVQPLWGQPELCNLGVNRVDFDLTKETKIQITPTAIFMGSIISGTDEDYQKRNCKPTLNLGDQCSLIAGPGIVQALRQTLFINPETGYPGLEIYDLEQGGQVIDDDGAWMLDVPMNLDYVITNEFGEQVISPDPKVGIPTKGKYRFKIKWVQGDTLSDPIKRGYFLVPNIREYWEDKEDDPFNYNNGRYQLINENLPDYGGGDIGPVGLAEKSYSFSTNWDDYPDPQVAIKCEDYFYELTYNKVYTVSQMMDSYNSGTLLNRKIAIKNILNSECASENNKFPVNDGQYRFDLIFILFSILLLVTFILLSIVVLVFHILGILLKILGQFLGFVLRVIVKILRLICDFINEVILDNLRGIGFPALNLDFGVVFKGCLIFCDDGWYPLKDLQNVTWCDDAADALTAWADFIENLYKKFENLQVPMLTYPDCELCDCTVGESTPGNDVGSIEDDPNIGVQKLVAKQLNKTSFLAPITLTFIFNKTRNLIPNLPSKTLLINQAGAPNPIPPITGTTPTSMFYRQQNTKVSSILAGAENNNDFLVDSKTRVPQSLPFGENLDYTYWAARAQNPVTNKRVVFSLSLPISERMNLFNLKSKYFNENLNNYHGLGVNRIKVTFGSDLNGGPLKYHYDNTLTLLLNDDQLKKLKPGQLLSFQNPYLSSDNSLNGLTDLNQYGSLSVTGTAINTGDETLINITYANPNGNGNLNVDYFLPQEDGDMYAKFATDIEYFMVITAMTYATFSSMCNPKETEVTLNKRYLGNSGKFEILKTDYGDWDYQASSAFTVNSLQAISDGKKQGVVICVRGVDPNSTKFNNKYDLSWLFGYNTDDAWGKRSEFIIEGEYYLNHPIKGNINSISHSISSNLDPDINLNQAQGTLYHDSFRFKPAFSGNASFSSYTTNLPMYYSSFDKLTPSGGNNIYKPDNSLTTPAFSEAIQNNNGVTNCLPNVSNYFVREYKRQYDYSKYDPDSGAFYPAPYAIPLGDCNPTWITTKAGLTGTSAWNYNEWGYRAVRPKLYQMNTNAPYNNKVYRNYFTSGTTYGIITAVASAYWANTGFGTGSTYITESLYSHKSYSLVAYSLDAGNTISARITIRNESTLLENSKLLTNTQSSNILISKIKILTFKWGEVAIVKLHSNSSPSSNRLNISFWNQDFDTVPNTVLPSVKFLGESLIDVGYLNSGGTSSFIDFDIEVDYISSNIILMFPVPSNSNMVVGGTALVQGVPVLMFITRAQRYITGQLIPNTFVNNSVFLPISTSPVNKTKITIYNESDLIRTQGGVSDIINLYACGYIKTSNTKLYFSVFDSNGILVKTFGPTGADNVGTYFSGNEILTTDNVTSFSLDFNPLLKQLIVCWINDTGQIYYKVFNVSIDNITVNTDLSPFQNEVTFNKDSQGWGGGGGGMPSDIILKVNRVTKEITISWQTPTRGVFTMKYFTATNSEFPIPLEIKYDNNGNQTGTTIFDIATNYGTPSSFNVTYKDNRAFGVPKKLVYSVFINREPLNRGYYSNEFLEGGGVMLLKSRYGSEYDCYGNIEQYLANKGKWGYNGYYYSPTYNKDNVIEIKITEDTTKLIMRSDRLPTSTTENKVDSLYGGNSSFALHTNQNFTAYLLDENGNSFELGGAPKIPSLTDSGQDDAGDNFATNVLATTTCDGLVPLDCYETTGNTIGVKPSGDACYYNGIGNVETDKIMKGGCYVLVTKVWDTLEKDLGLLFEWRNRINVNFAACRNVFGHVFRNNWINGTLFAFPIKNDRSFTPIFANPKIVNGSLIINKVSPINPYKTEYGVFFEPNSPYSRYCKDTVMLHSKTNEFYYRSSPFYKDNDNGSGAFIGINNVTYEEGNNGRNKKFIKFPTTIMDLGPRSKYLQEIVMSDDLDGYNIGNLNKSSFSDVSPLLNLFILSRTVTKGFTFLLTSFFSRSLYIDGDYAQMVATNSQVGVAPFDEANYGNKTGFTSQPIFFSTIGPTFGVFYDSDLEIRDLVSPRRTLINGDVPNSFCAFNELSNFSQQIPMYQWEIKQKLDETNTLWIFGNETNDWFTGLVTTTPLPEENETFFSYKYQFLDRLETQSRFFRTTEITKTNFYKGYIYNVSTIPNTDIISIDSGIEQWRKNPPTYVYDETTFETIENNNLVTFGTPFYFYFGLKNGKTAMDLFKRKWINSENVII